MRNLKLEIEYAGTHYHGWQVQNIKKARATYRHSQTIQQVLEEVLKKILQEDIGPVSYTHLTLPTKRIV